MTGLVAEFTLRRSEEFELSIDINVPAGSTTVLIGPNGAGKSTLVDVVAGLLAVDSGHIEIDATPVDAPDQAVFVPPESRSVGVVFQDYLLFPHMTVLENVAFGLRSRGVPGAESLSRAREWMQRLGLDGLGGRRPSDLSGGQAQRVALARALATEPRVLILDEPLSALDVSARSALRRTLAEHLAEFAGPRLMITHDPAEAFLFADSLAVIEEGSITQTGTVDEVRLGPRSAYAADAVGSNLFGGRAVDGVVDVNGQVLHIADHSVSGEVLISIHSHAISAHAGPPGGSPRNVWEAHIDQVENMGDRVRFITTGRLPVTVEVTRSSFEELSLEPGAKVWLAVKATEIGVQPA